MKFVITVVFYGFCYVVVYAQPSQLFRKKGIYMSFEEVQKNHPSVTDSFKIIEYTETQQKMWAGGKYGFHLLPDDKTRFREIKKNFTGISDGNYFYISDKYTIGGWQSMTICFLGGPYIIAPSEISISTYTVGGIIPSLFKSKKNYLVNLEDGSSRILTKRILSEFLNRYSILKEEYNNKDNLFDYSMEIFDKINYNIIKYGK